MGIALREGFNKLSHKICFLHGNIVFLFTQVFPETPNILYGKTMVGNDVPLHGVVFVNVFYSLHLRPFHCPDASFSMFSGCLIRKRHHRIRKYTERPLSRTTCRPFFVQKLCSIWPEGGAASQYSVFIGRSACKAPRTVLVVRYIFIY